MSVSQCNHNCWTNRSVVYEYRSMVEEAAHREELFRHGMWRLMREVFDKEFEGFAEQLKHRTLEIMQACHGEAWIRSRNLTADKVAVPFRGDKGLDRTHQRGE